MAPRNSNGRLNGELRRLLREEINRRVRARPDFIPPERLALLEALGVREHELICLGCGEPFTAKRPHALTCSGACRARRHKRRRTAPEALAA